LAQHVAARHFQNIAARFRCLIGLHLLCGFDQRDYPSRIEDRAQGERDAVAGFGGAFGVSSADQCGDDVSSAVFDAPL
jgi:hypothetical protein